MADIGATLTIMSCRACPFVEGRTTHPCNTTNSNRCGRVSNPTRAGVRFRLIRLEHVKRWIPPPEWCPLRTESVTVRLGAYDDARKR